MKKVVLGILAMAGVMIVGGIVYLFLGQHLKEPDKTQEPSFSVVGIVRSKEGDVFNVASPKGIFTLRVLDSAQVEIQEGRQTRVGMVSDIVIGRYAEFYGLRIKKGVMRPGSHPSVRRPD